jgi:thiol-disulfide isomerase/thioredoxin
MRKILFIYIVLLCPFFFSKSFGQKEIISKIYFTVEGELKGFKDSVKISLGLIEPYLLKGQAYTVTSIGSKFTITGETYNPTIATLSLFLLGEDGKPKYQFPEAPKLEFYLAAGITKVIITDSFKTISVKSPAQKEQRKFEALGKELDIYNTELQKLYLQQYKVAHGKTSDDSLLFVTSAARIKEVEKQMKPVYTNFVKTNNNSWLSSALLRTNIGGVFTASESEMLYKGFSSSLRESPMGNEIWRLIDRRINPSASLVGKEMPDIELFNMQGGKMNLSSFKGKYFLLDFWASWCSPCRKANPDLKSIYTKYGNSRFEIVSVSIDVDKEKWLEAVKEDSLTWPQLMDDNQETKSGWAGKAMMAYKGNSVPFSFMINPKGQIVQFNPTKDELEKMVKTIYANAK